MPPNESGLSASGCMKPISMVRTMSMPNQMASMCSSWVIGRKIGMVRVIIARPSRNMPSKSRIPTMAMITKIEDFFTKGCGRCERFATADCSSRLWQKGLAALRRLCLELGLTETVRAYQRCIQNACAPT